MIKHIGYGYPSSPIAAMLKKNKTGTWYVSDKRSDNDPKDRNPVAFPTFVEANASCTGHTIGKWSQRPPATDEPQW